MKTKLLLGAFFALSLVGCGNKTMLEQEQAKQSSQTQVVIDNTGIFGRMYYVRDEEGTCYSVIENSTTNSNTYSISHTVVDCAKYEKKLSIDRLVKK